MILSFWIFQSRENNEDVKAYRSDIKVIDSGIPMILSFWIFQSRENNEAVKAYRSDIKVIDSGMRVRVAWYGALNKITMVVTTNSHCKSVIISGTLFYSWDYYNHTVKSAIIILYYIFITPPWFRPVFVPVERDHNRVFRAVWVQTSL